VRRRRLSTGKSRRMFRKGANRVHRKNVSSASPMRGGIRL